MWSGKSQPLCAATASERTGILISSTAESTRILARPQFRKSLNCSKGQAHLPQSDSLPLWAANVESSELLGSASASLSTAQALSVPAFSTLEQSHLSHVSSFSYDRELR